jgi:hypothetical protein
MLPISSLRTPAGKAVIVAAVANNRVRAKAVNNAGMTFEKSHRLSLLITVDA